MHAPTQTVAQNLKYRSLTDFATMTGTDVAALLSLARRLQDASLTDANRRALRGKNVALLCDVVDDDESALFQRAASGLGAQVAHLRPQLSQLSVPQEVQHTAQLLGRLYDALDCVGMPSDLVGRIGAAAGVPVFEAISSRAHPIARLAIGLDPGQALDDNRCAVVRAVLFSALA